MGNGCLCMGRPPLKHVSNINAPPNRAVRGFRHLRHGYHPARSRMMPVQAPLPIVFYAPLIANTCTDSAYPWSRAFNGVIKYQILNPWVYAITYLKP